MITTSTNSYTPSVGATADQPYFTQSDLKDRGWTLSAITKFLGDPDKTKPNPMYRSAAPMKLWDKARVEVVERSAEFTDWKEGSKARRQKASETMTAVMQAKRLETIQAFTEALRSEVDQSLAWVKTAEDLERLEQQAIEHWYNHQTTRAVEGRGEYPEWPGEVDYDTRVRWVENYVRHALTNYDYLIYCSGGRVGRGEAYDAMKILVAAKVRETYKFSTKTFDDHDSTSRLLN